MAKLSLSSNCLLPNRNRRRLSDVAIRCHSSSRRSHQLTRPLWLEGLEDRALLATNLYTDSLTVTTEDRRPVANPLIGELVYFNARIQSSGVETDGPLAVHFLIDS
jgi:hypothetical protein